MGGRNKLARLVLSMNVAWQLGGVLGVTCGQGCGTNNLKALRMRFFNCLLCCSWFGWQ